MFNIAFGGIHIESSTFTPYVSGEADFQVRRGEELLQARYPFLERYRDRVNPTGLVHARALPGGPVDREFFDRWLAEFMERLEAAMNGGAVQHSTAGKLDATDQLNGRPDGKPDGQLDGRPDGKPDGKLNGRPDGKPVGQPMGQPSGLLLDLHGAMSVVGLEDAEGLIARTIRERFGDKLIISASNDLHGNVSDLLFDNVDFLTCYRTAPHVDVTETRERALRLLLHKLEHPETLHFTAKIDVPMLLPGEKTSTETEPGHSAYALAASLCSPALEAAEAAMGAAGVSASAAAEASAVLDVAVWMGFPWADEDRCHAAVVATGTDYDETLKAAQKVADFLMEQHQNFEFVGPAAPTEEAIREALSSESKPFFLSDTGDNPGAGGVGDMNFLLKEMLRISEEIASAEEAGAAEGATKKILIASLFDAESIEKIYSLAGGAASGESASGEAAGEENAQPSGGAAGPNQAFDMPPVRLALAGKEDKRFYGPIEAEFTVKNLFSDPTGGRGAVVSLKNFDIIVTERRMQYGTKEAFERAGISRFEDYDIIVVKMGYLEPDLARAARGWVMALTPGAVNQDLLSIDYQKRRRPLYPFEAISGMEFAAREKAL